MIHLIYVSSATRDMDEHALKELLSQSRSRNKKQNVTGMLLYVDGNFMQVLEGDAHDVDEIYGDIVQDQRHSGVLLIEREPITKRTFPEWSMGFKKLGREDAQSIEGFSEFLQRPMPPSEFANHTDEIVDLLYKFKHQFGA